jgi:hypothetical protein
LHDKKATTTCYGAGTHHRPGDYALDLKHGAVDSYITTNGGSPICMLPLPTSANPNPVQRPVYRVGNAVYYDEDSAHWHVNFNKSTCSGI